jgi:hypothetical protein
MPRAKYNSPSIRARLWHIHKYNKKERRPIRLSLSAKSANHSSVFFSHNKSAKSTFNHDLSAKQTGPEKITAPKHMNSLTMSP